mmetsp:Transcript_60113/g.161251  ORF Transcript_60113/g.161251 Transcript_60113/m.161251 type:complete len:263 (+) Transcript_60113:498-1286(+)
MSRTAEVTPCSRHKLEAAGCPTSMVEEVVASQCWRIGLQREASIVTDAYQGQTRTRNHCRQCQYSQVRFEPFLDLSLCTISDTGPLGTLADVLTATFNRASAVSWHCPQCQIDVSAGQTCSLWKLPPTLMVYLKRYDGCSSAKLGHSVEVPMELDLTPWVSPSSRQKVDPLYELVGVVEHEGNSLRHGHYTAQARRGGVWHTFDDSRVTSSGSVPHLRHDRVTLAFYQRRGDGGALVRQDPETPATWPHAHPAEWGSTLHSM